MSLKEILPKLQEWFAPEEHKERKLPGGGRWFFVPHQTITQRLNAVCPGEWHTKVGLTNIAGDYTVVMLELTICGVTRTGIGDDKTFPELNDEGKAKIIGTPPVRAFRAAFKDAAEQFGIAAYLDEQKANRAAFARYMSEKGDLRAYKFDQENSEIEAGARGQVKPKRKEGGFLEAVAGTPDRNLLNAEIESVMKRKGISTDQARAILQELFNARGRQQLSEKQLQEFLEYLKTSPERLAQVGVSK